MQLVLDLQNRSSSPQVPDRSDLELWARAALEGVLERAELSVLVVDEEEGAALNRRWRGRRGATNVLSFPCEAPPGVEDLDLIGDLVICSPVVSREAAEQGKTPHAHWAHMLIHGVLHLIGQDHQDEAQAETMEALETTILSGLGFPPPYEQA